MADRETLARESQRDLPEITSDPDRGIDVLIELGNGRELTLQRMLFTTRVTVGPAGRGWYDHAWCYERREDAWAAFVAWDGEGAPPGPWIKQAC